MMLNADVKSGAHIRRLIEGWNKNRMQNELLSSENFHHRNRNSLQMTEECQNILKDLFDDSKYKISTESMESMEEIIDNTENIYQNDDYSNYNYDNDNNL